MSAYRPYPQARPVQSIDGPLDPPPSPKCARCGIWLSWGEKGDPCSECAEPEDESDIATVLKFHNEGRKA